MYARFRHIGKVKDGKFTSDDILRARPELIDNPLTQRVFEVFDVNRDGAVSFSEFVMGLSRITRNDGSKLHFLFDLYDLDKDGFISNSDLFHIVRLMAKDIPESEVQQLVDRTLRDCDGDYDDRVGFGEFEQAVGRICLARQLDIDI